ncbi:helix-turn-helix transcriptional regulator [Marinomonas balearica]|uniref:Regulatory LuxR family protein n=1 Tax=Marinomonas balearica TaxID=491947 RepID=A0A4R6M733_9GAMM|nr:helix-turn-helix transcriptional regulator [Marinomonas balearica]TDO95889.1 regulatory LuxR family protein [Marinomonas balearica]
MDIEIVDAVSALYSTINAPKRNEETYDKLASVFGSAGMTQYSESNQSFNLQISSSIYKRYGAEFAEYNKRYSQYESEGINRLFEEDTYGWLTEQEGWLEEENVIDREDFLFIREKTGLARTVGVNLSEPAGWKHAVIIHYPEIVKDIPKNLDKHIALLAPHIAKTVNLNSFLHGLYYKYQAVLSVLDGLSVAVCVCDYRGYIIVSNRQAQHIVSMKDGVYLKNRKLCFSNSEQNSQFRASTRKIAGTSQGKGNLTGVSFFIERPSGKHPFYVEQSPIKDGCYEVENNLSGSIIYIIDTQSPPEIDVSIFASVISLTPSEAHISNMIFKGLKDRDMADYRGVSVETVRKQIKSILSKAQVNSRIELLIKAVSIRPPIL